MPQGARLDELGVFSLGRGGSAGSHRGFPALNWWLWGSISTRMTCGRTRATCSHTSWPGVCTLSLLTPLALSECKSAVKTHNQEVKSVRVKEMLNAVRCLLGSN